VTELLLVEFTVEGSNWRTVGVVASYSGAALSLDYLFPYVSKEKYRSQDINVGRVLSWK